ncbi:T9SS type A sorting domain-containing protein [Flavitalea flava]
MKKNLLRFFIGSGVLLGVSLQVTQAQIKGDPELRTTTLQQPGQPKSASRLSPDLKSLSEKSGPNAKVIESTRKPGLSTDALSRYMQISGNSVVVDITVTDDINTALPALTKIGLRVSGVFGRVISGAIPISALSQLEATPSIRFAKPAYKPMHLTNSAGRAVPGARAIPGSTTMPGYLRYLTQSARNTAKMAPTPKITPVISQGDTAMLAYVARKKYNVNGKGVKVGVLSDSYNNLGGAATGVLHGELPGHNNPFNFKKPVQVLKELGSGGTDEGRAMMEIIHDVAPGAELAFHTADSGMADFAQGIVDLQKAGCDVIADDVIYYAEPFFQDGIIAQAVDQVKKKGATYFSSAGNSSIRSYESEYRPTHFFPFADTTLGTAHNFSGPTDPPRYAQPIYIPQGGILISSFQWDQSSFTASGVGPESDYDIYLTNSKGQIVAAGNSDNMASGDPIEVFGYYNDTQDVTFYLTIVKFFGPDATRLKYLLYNDALFYLTRVPIPGILSPALVGHAKAAGAIATGAAFYLQTPPYGVDTPVVEGFSSVGGTANYIDILGNRIAPLVRNKPEIVAPDGGNTSFFDPFGNGDITEDKDSFPNFFGTSAAAPHAAGVAALMIEAQKIRTITPDQIKGVMSSHTWDMDDPYTTGFDKGFDFTTGYGLIKADKAVGAVKFPNLYIKNLDLDPICSDNPTTTRNWRIRNPNPFPVEAHWIVLGTQLKGTIYVQPGDTSFSTKAQYWGNRPIPTIVVIDWQDNFEFPRFDIAYSTRAQCNKDMVSESNSDKQLNGSGNKLGNGVADAFATNKINMAEVYPNPSVNTIKLYLSLSGDQSTDIELYSVDGKRLQTKRVAQSNGVIDIDASAYRPGVYILKVVQGNFVKTIKVIKQ